MVLMAQGSKRMAVGDQVHDYRAGQCLIASVDLPVTGHFNEASPAAPALGFALNLRPPLVAELLLHPAAADFPRVPRGAAAPSAIIVSRAGEELIEVAIRAVRLLEHERDIPVLAPMIERELTWLLMRGEHGATVRQLGLADSSLSRVGHAIRWIREQYSERIRVDELAEMTRMSASAFHRSFHAITAMSPIQFQKEIRLQEARIRLLAEPRDVAGAAFQVGYESASQFSREYRRRFGESPVNDVARIRESARDGAER